MSVKKDKTASIKKVSSDSANSGDSLSQISIFTDRIKYLTEHLKTNKKDNSARRGLVMLVSKRKKLLTYVKKRDMSAYQDVIKKLNIRK
tara:strand:+ start:261 stop:527 length:267 start_codon:yes stop_codon:yes gene_type:complete